MIRGCGYCGVVALLLITRNDANSQHSSFFGSSVEIQMRAVNFHLDHSTVFGSLTFTRTDGPYPRGRPVSFDDPNSFVTRITSAEIAISTGTLSDLLNQRVFDYPSAPVKKISISTERDKMVIENGVMHKGVDVPFEVKGTPGCECCR
jgi:hypothetical protein